ncbi:MAG: AlbA family DNA-binding domain-containing protein [Candidatus Dormibacteria bacterium]
MVRKPAVGLVLLRLGEDPWFDHKSARISPRDLAEDLVGLANAEGGTIVLGLFGGEAAGVDGLQPRPPAHSFCK